MREILVLAALCITSSLVCGQERGGVVGTVADQNGAVVSGAKITVTNSGTSQTRTVTSSSSGDYSVPNLPVGLYTATAEQPGFKRATGSNIKVDVQQTVRIDFTLQVGQVTDQVTVTGVAPLLQTDDAQIGALIENKRVEDLPLNGRNFTQLALLVPGATEGTSGNYVSTYGLGPRGSGVSFSINGQQSSFNQFLIDGVPAKESQHEEQIVPEEQKPKEEKPAEVPVQQQAAQVATQIEQSSGAEQHGGDTSEHRIYLGQLRKTLEKSKINPRSRETGTVLVHQEFADGNRLVVQGHRAALVPETAYRKGLVRVGRGQFAG